MAILVSLFAVLASVTLPALAQSIGSYRLGSGDKIAISVYGEDGMSVEQRLHDEGVIVYPFLGELQVGGRTVAEVERMITEGLKPRYLVDPRVRVSIAEYRPFFVDGEVESPGGYPYQPGLTVRKAVSLAGGLTERASKRKIDVIREGESESSRVDMNEPLNPGDIVTIQQGFF